MIVNPNTKEDLFDQALRPKKWEHFVGQKKIKENIQIIINAAQKRNEAIDHLLFAGAPGLGKSTLARLIAETGNSNIKTTAGPVIQRPGDLAAILTSLSEKDVLFIDEIHRLNKICEEIIYPAMEDFRLHIITGTGPMARTLEIELPPFTLIGATTRIGLLSPPFRNRFGAIFQLEHYSQEDIEAILKRSSRVLDIKTEDEAIKIISKSSRMTPRIANRILKRVRDFAQIKGSGIINKDITQLALNNLEIDDLGLEPLDRKILKTIIEKFQGGPVGIQALAAAISEEPENILEVHEPYLLQIGLVKRTAQGRVVSHVAYQHLKIFFSKTKKLL